MEYARRIPADPGRIRGCASSPDHFAGRPGDDRLSATLSGCATPWRRGRQRPRRVAGVIPATVVARDAQHQPSNTT